MPAVACEVSLVTSDFMPLLGTQHVIAECVPAFCYQSCPGSHMPHPALAVIQVLLAAVLQNRCLPKPGGDC